MSQLRRARRQAEHDRPAAVFDRRGDLADFRWLVGMVGNAVDLDEVESPTGILLQHRIVVGLAGGVVLDAVVAVVPRTQVVGVGCVGGVEVGSGNGHVVAHGRLGNSADDVNAEFQTLRVGPRGQRGQAGSALGRGETIERRHQESVVIQFIVTLLELRAGRVAHVPAFIDDGIRPAKLTHLRQDSDVGFEVSLGDGEAVGVPAVPAHGWCRGEWLWHQRAVEVAVRWRRTEPPRSLPPRRANSAQPSRAQCKPVKIQHNAKILIIKPPPTTVQTPQSQT